MRSDFHYEGTATYTVLPQTTSGTATISGSSIDLAGYEGAEFVFSAGAIAGTGSFLASLEYSDTGTSNWAATASADRVGSFSTVGPGTASGGTAVQAVGYIGTARYVRGVVTMSAGTPNTPVTMTALRYRARHYGTSA